MPAELDESPEILVTTRGRTYLPSTAKEALEIIDEAGAPCEVYLRYQQQIGVAELVAMAEREKAG